MPLFDIDSLKRDAKQDELYDLFVPTFELLTEIQQSPIVVGKEEMMRIDLICHRLYQSIDEVDFLCSLNDIDNPLNIMENDTLFYTAWGAIDSFRIRESDKISTRQSLLNPNKSTKKDRNREKFIENGFALPPTYNPIPRPAVRIDGNDIVIGG